MSTKPKRKKSGKVTKESMEGMWDKAKEDHKMLYEESAK